MCRVPLSPTFHAFRFFAIGVGLLLTIQPVARATDSVYDRQPNLNIMPPAIFFIECGRILETDDHWDWNTMWEGEDWQAKMDRTRSQGQWRSRSAAYHDSRQHDVAEFRVAVKDIPQGGQLANDYATVRQALSEHFGPWLQQLDAGYYGNREIFPGPFELAPWESVVAKFPAEFALYLRGAVAYHNRDDDAAIAHFKGILDLPPNQRRYRSTWAAFMLGKSWTRKDPSQAPRYFQQTRELAAKGFLDSLELAAASTGWETHALLADKKVVEAIHRYAEAKTCTGINLRYACKRILSEKQYDITWAKDDLSQRLLTAWLTANPNAEEPAKKWLSLIEEVQRSAAVMDPDRIAWLHLNLGNLADAQRWVDKCTPDQPYAQWIQAKLYLRTGKRDEGIAQLKSIATTFPRGSIWRVHCPYHGAYTYSTDEVKDLIKDDLALMLLKAGDYESSLVTYFDASNYNQVEFVAERVVTLDELQHVIETYSDRVQPDDRRLRQVSSGDYDMSSILARRCARAGDWERASKFYPEQPVEVYDLYGPNESSQRVKLRALALDMKRWTEIANDPDASNELRAESLYNLGHNIFTCGPVLYNPTLWPSGDSESNEGAEFPHEFYQRVAESQKPYPQVNYFVHVAADYMWRSAELRPNNDVMGAKALYLGGLYLKKVDRKKAERFYQALVRRHPNLLVAQQAKQLRWFPRKFTDTVTRQPIPKHWYGRKRNLAAAGVSAALVFLVAGGATWRLRRRPPS